MIWADKTAIGAGIIAMVILVVLIDAPAMGTADMTWGLVADQANWIITHLCLPVWIILRTLDFIATGSFRRRN